MSEQTIEIMAPVGSYESLMAAIQGGANSVYFGVGKLNMRARSSANFSLEDLARIAEICAENNIKSYLTLNTIIFDHELEEMRATLRTSKDCGVSAVIASDLSVISHAREIGFEVHISTQCNITNIEAVRFFAQFADVVVTARELSLSQVKAISQQIKEQNICGPKGELIQLEAFVHGALCMAVSGKCYLSLHNHNSSANRGACFQDCRRKYQVKSEEKDVSLLIDNEYIMSPKDLKTIHFLDQVLGAGIRVLKIEGRGRTADYVRTVTECYREAANSCLEGTFSKEKVEEWEARLGTVYNRGFWDGYYLGQRLGEWCDSHGSKATKKKILIGKVENYFSKSQVAHLVLHANEIAIGDELLITGTSTGVYQFQIPSMLKNSSPCQSAQKGEDPTIPVTQRVRSGDKVYKIVPSEDYSL